MSLPSRSGRLALYVALAAVIFFGRAWLIRSSGSSVPFWDQWDGEALGLYRPWLDGSFHWSLLWQPHNEHRIVLTRLLDLLLLSGLGTWNLWVQQLVNATLHTGIAVLLATRLSPGLSRHHQTAWLGAMAALFLATAGWQNALWGFQSQIYFTSLLGVAAVTGLVMNTPNSGGWWGGLGCAFLALFSTGGGLLAAVAAGAISAFTPHSRTLRTRSGLGLLAVAAVAGIGVWLSTTVPGHAPLQARSLAQFVAVFSRCLAWPWVNLGVVSIPLQLPFVILLWQRWRSGTPLDRWERGALGVLVFTWLQAAGVAYSRGQGLPDARPLSRYQDLLIPGLGVQVFALLRLGVGTSAPVRATSSGWCGLVLAGLIHLTEQNLTFNLPYKRAQDRAGLSAIQDYVASRDPAALTRDPTFPPPHPDPRVIQRVIDDPVLQPILPHELFSRETSACSLPPRVVRAAPIGFTVAGLLWLISLAVLWRSAGPLPRTAATPPPEA